jgi:biotin transporter BioY
MKVEISFLSVVILAVIYACGWFVLSVYVVHSLWMAALQAGAMVPGLEMLR